MSKEKINHIIEKLDIEKKVVLSFDNYKKELFSLYEEAYNQSYIFRGFSNDDEILPNVVRKCKINGGKTISDIWNYESTVLEKFSRYSIQYLPYYEKLIDWIAAAQHYGLPTRLIDWTYNLDVGLFFSIGKPNNEKKELGSSYLIVCKLNDKRIVDDFDDFHGHWIDSDPRSKKDILLLNYNNIDKNGFSWLSKASDDYSESMCFIKGNAANPRIIMQEGPFQIGRIDGNNEESIDEYERRCLEQYIDTIEKIYIVPQELKAKLREFLDEKRVTKLRLFPDLQNICNYIIESTTVK